MIIAFVEEAIRCFKAEAYLGCAFMLGAASERAIGTLIQTFGESTREEKNKERFFSRVNARMISKTFEEFQKSYAGCQNKPTDVALTQDLDVLIGNMSISPA